MAKLQKMSKRPHRGAEPKSRQPKGGHSGGGGKKPLHGAGSVGMFPKRGK
jgi:hypothetical protein